MNETKIIGYTLIGAAALHLVLGANDPLSSLWTALATSLEVAVLLLGFWLIYGKKFA
jgi:hypothetical protein